MDLVNQALGWYHGTGAPNLRPAPTSLPGDQSFLVVFDFDHTVLDCDTDSAMGGRPTEQTSLSQSGMQWTMLIDTLIAPYTDKELRALLKERVVVDPHMKEVFQLLHAYQTQWGSSHNSNRVEVHIASDANQLFIDGSLDAVLPDAKAAISQVHTNGYQPVYYGDAHLNGDANEEERDPMLSTEVSRDAQYNAGKQRRSRLQWYDHHQCPQCLAAGRPNICKSQIIQRILHNSHLIDPTIIFVGDGCNDYCPVRNVLRPRDYVFARSGFALHKRLSEEPWGCCHVRLWSDAVGLKGCFEVALAPSRRLPTLVRFRDVAEAEFRSKTIHKRLPGIVQRVLDSQRASMSPAGIEQLTHLVKSMQENDTVPPLPGQRVVGEWLQNYSYTSEYDAAGETHRRPPRWGQIPWLHGEVYLYHLVWQMVMLKGGQSSSQSSSIVNHVSTYTSGIPLLSMDSGYPLATPRGPPVGPPLPDISFLSKPLPRGSVQHCGAPPPSQDVYRLPPAGICLPVPSVDEMFCPYRDVFEEDKRDVTLSFTKLRVVPMVCCKPWERSGDDSDMLFLPVLLRWMLWGNGADLSMFTLEQLQANNARADGANSNGAGKDNQIASAAELLLKRRKAEKVAMEQLEPCLAGNETAALEAFITALVKHQPPAGREEAFATNHIDIVTDNVGVEFFSDLLFGLWFIHHSVVNEQRSAAPTVTYHVKPIPYYISDVTSADFEKQLSMLEQEAPEYTKEEQEAVHTFIQLVREALTSGSFAVTSDAVWAQPCEYRELPPRVLNQHFFTRVLSTAREEGLVVTPTTALVLLKGDLNYRRLIGDRHWCRTDFTLSVSMEESGALKPIVPDHVEALLSHTRHGDELECPSFCTVMQQYWPVEKVAVSSLRTIKSECCLGVPAEIKKKLDAEKGLQWRLSGSYGVILLAAPPPQ